MAKHRGFVTCRRLHFGHLFPNMHLRENTIKSFKRRTLKEEKERRNCFVLHILRTIAKNEWKLHRLFIFLVRWIFLCLTLGKTWTGQSTKFPHSQTSFQNLFYIAIYFLNRVLPKVLVSLIHSQPLNIWIGSNWLYYIPVSDGINFTFHHCITTGRLWSWFKAVNSDQMGKC